MRPTRFGMCLLRVLFAEDISRVIFRKQAIDWPRTSQSISFQIRGFLPAVSGTESDSISWLRASIPSQSEVNYAINEE